MYLKINQYSTQALLTQCIKKIKNYVQLLIKNILIKQLKVTNNSNSSQQTVKSSQFHCCKFQLGQNQKFWNVIPFRLLQHFLKILKEKLKTLKFKDLLNDL